MERITITNLRKTVESINKMLPKPIFGIDAAYGGYKIESADSSRDLTGRGTARETQSWLFAWRAGFFAAVDEHQGSGGPRYRTLGLAYMLDEAARWAVYFARDTGDDSADRAYAYARDAVRFARIMDGGAQ